MRAYEVIPNRYIKSHPPLVLCLQFKKSIKIGTFPYQSASFVKPRSKKMAIKITFKINQK